MTEKEPLIGTAELARRLGVSPRTIHRRVQAGTLKPTIVAPGGYSGVWLFRESDAHQHTKNEENNS